jgi:hypothetical protein
MLTLPIDVISLPLAEAIGCALGGALVTLLCCYQTITVPRGPLRIFIDLYLRWRFLLYGAPMMTEAYDKVIRSRVVYT